MKKLLESSCLNSILQEILLFYYRSYSTSTIQSECSQSIILQLYQMLTFDMVLDAMVANSLLVSTISIT